MREFFLCIASILMLAGCASTSYTGKMYEVRSGYDTFLVAAVTYAGLPRCSATVPAPCSSAEAVVQINQAVQSARLSLDVVETAVRMHPNGVDAAAAISTAQSAVATVGKILTIYGVK